MQIRSKKMDDTTYSAGLSFAVYTFPIVAIAILGLLLMDLKAGYQRSR